MPTTDTSTRDLLGVLARAGVAAEVVHDGPADSCPACSPLAVAA